MATLTLYNEAQTVFDLTGVIAFDVIQHPGSLQWIVRAVLPAGAQDIELLSRASWGKAHLDRSSLQSYVIDEGVSVKEDDVTGSIVPV